MQELLKLFKPITIDPYNKSDFYIEIMPCDALSPYIRCFWGSLRPYKRLSHEPNKSIVIPDCCMDIIFDVNYSENKINNVFCSLNDAPFYIEKVNDSNIVSSFGIRFNFGAVHLFLDNDVPKKCNEFGEVEKYFKSLKNEIENIIIQYSKIEDRVSNVEKLLIRKLYNSTIENNRLLNGVYYILKTKGLASVIEISQYTSVSSRQLERIFREHLGISPKVCSSLVKYQNIWQDIVMNKYRSFTDITYNYGYSDQAHMINAFKRYHGSTPMQAAKDLKR